MLHNYMYPCRRNINNTGHAVHCSVCNLLVRCAFSRSNILVVYQCVYIHTWLEQLLLSFRPWICADTCILNTMSLMCGDWIMLPVRSIEVLCRSSDTCTFVLLTCGLHVTPSFPPWFWLLGVPRWTNDAPTSLAKCVTLALADARSR